MPSCDAPGSEYNSGGTVSVNAWTITVPQNLIVQFPTVFSPFKAACGAGARGFETTVVGNIVDNKPIAGQIVIAQRFGLEGSQGYISAINSDGTLQIQNGPRVRVNDPEGLFAPQVNTNPFFAADTKNPSVASFSGFPMCIPYSGNTDKCLASNRGSGNAFDAPDPLRMVPLKVGDFIEYSGLLVGGEVLASEITCVSVHVTTKAGPDVPNYIRIEDMIIGVADGAANVEFADIKVVGFLSSCPNSIVTISAIDVDACTGKETYRQIGQTQPKQETRCKFDVKIATQNAAPYTREYRITTNTPVKETKDGLIAGEFIAAVGEWIFPEVDVPGTFPPPNPFKDIQDLNQGTVLDGKQYGPLSPFPGSATAPKKSCSPSDLITATPTPSAAASSSAPDASASVAPSATPSAGAVTPPAASVAAIANVQRVGTNFVLTGSNTESKYTNNDLNFQWSQISPSTPTATITSATAPTATVNAARVTSETSFVYELTISLKSDSTVSSKANVTVKVNPNIKDTVEMTTYTWDSKKSGTITAACTSNVINGDNKVMTLQLTINNVVDKRTMIQNGAGKWFYSGSTNRPTNLKCVSDLLGESALRTGTQTTARRRRRYGTF